MRTAFQTTGNQLHGTEIEFCGVCSSEYYLSSPRQSIMFSYQAHAESFRRTPADSTTAQGEDTFQNEGSRASNSSRPAVGQHAQAEQHVERSHKSSSWGRFVERLACFHPSTLHDEPSMRDGGEFDVEASTSSLMVRQLQRDQSCTMSSYLSTAPSSLSKSSSRGLIRKGRRASATDAYVYGYPEQQPKSDIFL